MTVSGSQHRETLYFNRMFTLTQTGTRDIESKHIFVGNTRIVTKRRQAGHDNVGHELRMQYFYHGDHLGSVQLVTDWEGNIYEHLEYTPYGELWVDHSVRSVGAYPTVFRFTAHERDPETGFTYAGARYLDPRTSRWISADPAMWEGDYFPRPGQGMQGLGGLGGIFNIINMHVFHYAGNNPIRYVDPDGREIDIFTRNLSIVPFELSHIEVGFFNTETNQYTITGVNLRAGAEAYFNWANERDIDFTRVRSNNFDFADPYETKTGFGTKEHTVAFSITFENMTPELVDNFRASMLTEFGFDRRDTFSVSPSQTSLMMNMSLLATTRFAPGDSSTYNVLNNSCVTHVSFVIAGSTMMNSNRITTGGFAQEIRDRNLRRFIGSTTR